MRHCWWHRQWLHGELACAGDQALLRGKGTGGGRKWRLHLGGGRAGGRVGRAGGTFPSSTSVHLLLTFLSNTIADYLYEKDFFPKVGLEELNFGCIS